MKLLTLGELTPGTIWGGEIMRGMIASIIALGASAMMIAMRDRNNRRKMQNMFKPMMNMQMANMMPSRKTMKRFRKRMRRTFA